MTKKRIINLFGWAFILFLTIGYIFYSEQFSWVYRSFWGLICILVGAFLMWYKPKSKV